MPHLPRRLPTTIGIAPELQRPPVAKHEPLPSPPSTVQAGTGAKPARLSMKLPKISPRTYEPDGERVLKSVFGKKTEVDPDTGQLILPSHIHPVM